MLRTAAVLKKSPSVVANDGLNAEVEIRRREVQQHYDLMSPYYRELWGEHIHHGYWISGRETKEQAQIQLIEHVAQAARVEPGSRILDVGCGMGGSSIYLSRHYRADVTGITISPIQVEMANASAAAESVSAKFLLVDAESMEFDEAFDVIWSVEAISHFGDKGHFFATAAKALKPGGIFVLTDWFQKKNLTPRERKKYIEPIEKAMICHLDEMQEYQNLLRANGFELQTSEILNDHCARSWDIGLDIIKDKKLWAVAAEFGWAFVEFLRGFRAMRAGFRSGSFVYGLVVAQRTK